MNSIQRIFIIIFILFLLNVPYVYSQGGTVDDKGEYQETLSEWLETVYKKAVHFYQLNKYEEAKAKFIYIEEIKSDYESTRSFLKRIDKHLEREQERRQRKQMQALQRLQRQQEVEKKKAEKEAQLLAAENLRVEQKKQQEQERQARIEERAGKKALAEEQRAAEEKARLEKKRAREEILAAERTEKEAQRIAVEKAREEQRKKQDEDRLAKNKQKKLLRKQKEGVRETKRVYGQIISAYRARRYDFGEEKIEDLKLLLSTRVLPDDYHAKMLGKIKNMREHFRRIKQEEEDVRRQEEARREQLLAEKRKKELEQQQRADAERVRKKALSEEKRLAKEKVLAEKRQAKEVALAKKRVAKEEQRIAVESARKKQEEEQLVQKKQREIEKQKQVQKQAEELARKKALAEEKRLAKEKARAEKKAARDAELARKRAEKEAQRIAAEKVREERYRKQEELRLARIKEKELRQQKKIKQVKKQNWDEKRELSGGSFPGQSINTTPAEIEIVKISRQKASVTVPAIKVDAQKNLESLEILSPEGETSIKQEAKSYPQNPVLNEDAGSPLRSPSQVKEDFREASKLSHKRESLRKKLLTGVEDLYVYGVELYNRNSYKMALEILAEVDKLWPDYKLTKSYLSQIDSVLQQADSSKEVQDAGQQGEDAPYKQLVNEELDKFVKDR